MFPFMTGAQEQGSIKLRLLNSDLWKAFHTKDTEMVITKHGRRMFPHCHVGVSGLDPFKNYVIMMEMVPVDQLKYKWNKDEEWEVAGEAKAQPPARTYTHPDSPSSGSHWMKQPISFLKAKLTNNTLDQHGHIILHSMQRYSPRFYVVQADSTYTARWSPYQAFSFPETNFTTVTAYQNTKITKLKIDHNPFAKGFREGGFNFSGLQGSLSATKSAKRHCPNSHLPWSGDQGPAESTHTDILDLSGQGHGCEEQIVPASMAYQAYRLHTFPEYRPPSAYSNVDGRLRCYKPHLPDVATVPGHHNLASQDTMHQHHNHMLAPGQESRPHFASAVATGPAKANPGLRASYPLYGHGSPYPGEHTEAEPGRLHHHHGNTADWSQYPFFSYPSW
ncbi:hypothetical protein NHX12_027391 [Muraenolepis orangiensis]|uniref:T-box domain-containing protein n=1 Tax=Muraenolepis orangiensis TaxID=630683 RepID=A0A9Q0EDI2_9TELE|nr:hypothetical protein NHX12_027391 [Muraenolepis orangiensis]